MLVPHSYKTQQNATSNCILDQDLIYSTLPHKVVLGQNVAGTDVGDLVCHSTPAHNTYSNLQVLVNELRQPELEAGDNTNSLAVILADHVNGQTRLGEHRNGRRNRLPRSPDRGPTVPLLAVGSSD